MNPIVKNPQLYYFNSFLETKRNLKNSGFGSPLPQLKKEKTGPWSAAHLIGWHRISLFLSVKKPHPFCFCWILVPKSMSFSLFSWEMVNYYKFSSYMPADVTE
jgi:hypothetical protein